MNGQAPDDDSYILTTEMEDHLIRNKSCKKLRCNAVWCLWITPGKHGITAPNPDTTPKVKRSLLDELDAKITRLDQRGINKNPHRRYLILRQSADFRRSVPCAAGRKARVSRMPPAGRHDRLRPSSFGGRARAEGFCTGAEKGKR